MPATTESCVQKKKKKKLSNILYIISARSTILKTSVKPITATFGYIFKKYAWFFVAHFLPHLSSDLPRNFTASRIRFLSSLYPRKYRTQRRIVFLPAIMTSLHRLTFCARIRQPLLRPSSENGNSCHLRQILHDIQKLDLCGNGGVFVRFATAAVVRQRRPASSVRSAAPASRVSSKPFPLEYNNCTSCTPSLHLR
jgi:hypothetical protein